MTLPGRIGRALALSGAVAGLAAAVTGAALRRSLPQTSGALVLPGLRARVEVIRDRWGVPHIYAQHNTDLFQAQGFVHAQDRLWQMEFQRRLAHGQLAEVFGVLALDTDRFMRVLGLTRAARAALAQLDDESRSLINSYCAGVNALIAQQKRRLPVEFVLLRLRPRMWEPADVLIWGLMMALQLAGNWQEELLNARILALVGAERAAQRYPHYADGAPLTVPPGASYTPQIGEAALAHAHAIRQFFVDGGGQGSNAWAVSGAHSASQLPLLANDPHLAITMPGLWYENHLSGGDFHVTGASVPGMPAVIIGHNEHVAWGITSGMIDTQDLYLERFDPADAAGLRYEVRGEWQQAELIHETITIAGRSTPHIEPVKITRHGPIISAVTPDMLDTPLALRWMALDHSRVIEGAFALNRAHDWSSFRAALARWDAPVLNMVYADVAGNIGYSLAGAVPIRATGDGTLPVPGWTDAYEWRGVIPADALPHSYNPPGGVVVTANTRLVDDAFAHKINGEWLNGYRAARIAQLLAHSRSHEPVSFAQIQADRLSLPGLQLASLAGRLPAEDTVAIAARALLAGWDGEMSAVSSAALIASRLRDQIQERAYAEVAVPLAMTVGVGGFAGFPGHTYRSRAFPQLLARITARDDAWLGGGRTWDGLLAAAWRSVVAELRAEYGDDPHTWRYGQAHTLTIRHPLGDIPVLGRLLNRGPYPSGGDQDTVNMVNQPRKFAGAPFYIAPSYRQICDTGDWNRSQSIQPTGQSGQPASRHYADFVTSWRDVCYHPMPWSRARVEEVAVARLQLEPPAQ